MTHRHLALVAGDETAERTAMPPDDRDGWQHPGAHSQTDDGRLLARIDERTTNIMRQIDDIAETAYKMIDGQKKEIDALDARITTLEQNWTRIVAYGGVVAAVVVLVAPLLQSAVRVAFHLP